MRRFVLWLVVGAAMLGLSACVDRPPPAPGDSSYSGAQATEYRKGYHRGHEDGQSKAEDNYERYYREFTASTRAAFEMGYHRGYEVAAPRGSGGGAEQLAVYEAGREAGRTDRQNGLAPSPQRYVREYPPSTEEDFTRGYEAGFREVGP